MTEPITNIEERIERQRLAAVRARDLASLPPHEHYRYFEPLEAAAFEWSTWAKSAERRIYTGLPDFDKAMRGIAPKELCLVNGYAHSGKTVFVTQMIRNNAARRIAMFTPDETRVAVLIKLASLVHGVSAEALEQAVQNGDDSTEKMVRAVASECFPTLAVWDEPLSIPRMDDALDEAQDYWGGIAEVLIFDYAKLLLDIDDMVAKINALKAWGKRRDVPLVLVNQSSRSKGSDGAEQTIDSGEYGGEQQATFVVGVRRKKNFYASQMRELRGKIAAGGSNREKYEDQLVEAEWEYRQHADSISFNLTKNKRPPSRLVDEIDFRIDPETGLIEPMHGSAVDEWTPTPTRRWDQLTMPDAPAEYGDDEEPF